jgi:DNA mismatch endonuclease Vsr
VSKLKVVELYAGTARSIEPFRHWKRAEIALLVDANSHARDTYLLNHPGASYAQKDISTFKSDELLRLAGGRVDVLMGWPPCQGFSETGLRPPDDPRNEHVHHFARFAEALRPLAVVMENVPRVTDSLVFASLVLSLERAGYSWTSMIANSAQYGGCQSRQRLLFVALRKDVGIQPLFKEPTHGGLVFPRLRRVIFVHGCFWQRHPGCRHARLPKSRTDYWVPKLSRNQARDSNDSARLEALGWEVLVIWECEATSVAAAADIIAPFLRGVASARPPVLGFAANG